MRLNSWYKNLTPLKQPGILLPANWIIWFTAWLIGDNVFFDEKHSLIYHIFHATWMALFITIVFNPGKIKSFFKGNSNSAGI